MKLEEEIWDLCEKAINNGVSPREFVQEMQLAWPSLLIEKQARDRIEIERLLKVVK